MENVKYNTKGMKFISIVLGAVVTGFMWRCRGESGFGSSWGLFSVGFVLMLFIYQFYGKRSGMKYENILIGSLMMGAGVTGYATVIEQMSGVLNSDLPYQGEVVDLPIDPISGMYIILIMGVTLVPLFAFYIGTLFSGKEYKVHHYLIAIAIFYAVSNIMKVTVSPYILAAINPDQVDCAAKGLADSGIDLSPLQAYLKHFGDRAFTQEIPFNENYYMSVEHISDAFGVVGVILYALIGFKDKITAFFTAFIDIFVSISTTVCTSLLIVDCDTGLLANVKAPRAFHSGSGWGVWEFCTGFSVGLFTMLAIAIIPKKYTALTQEDISPIIKNDKLNFAFNFLATVFVGGVVPARVVGIRFAKFLKYQGFIEDTGALGEILCAVGAVIFGLIILKKFLNNSKAGTLPLIGVSPVKYADRVFNGYIIMCCIVYFFLNRAPLLHLEYSEMTSLSKFVEVMNSPQNIATTVMLIAFAVFAVIYYPLRAKKLKNM